MNLKNPLSYGFLSIGILSSWFFVSPLFSQDLSCLGQASCDIANEEPQLLSEFPYGCYGTDSTFGPVLIPENEPTIGSLFLVKLDPNAETYNLILCASNTPPVEFEFIHFRDFFTRTVEEQDDDGNIISSEEVVLDQQFFLANDYSGTFEVAELGEYNATTDTYPGYILMATDGGIQFLRDEIRYTVAGLRVEEEDFENEEEGISSKMLPNLEFAIQRGNREQEPIFESPTTRYNNGCVLSDPNSYCVLEADVVAPELDEADYISSAVVDPADPLGAVVPSSPSFDIDEGEQFSYRFQARDTDGIWDLTHEFKMIEKGGKTCVLDDTDPSFDEDTQTLCAFDDYFVYDDDTFTLNQKEGVVLTQEESPYTLKVTVQEINNATGSTLSPVAGSQMISSGVYAAAQTDPNKGLTNVVERFNISVVPPSEIVSSGEAGVAPPVATSRPTVNGGGQDEIVVNRLKNGVEFQTIGEHEEVEDDAEVLFCPREKYFRYPENRGSGVSSSLFADAPINHRSYLSLIDLAEQGIVNGDSQSGNARLDDSISRAEFVKIMTIAREDTLLLGDCLKFSNFVDIPHNAWFTPFVQNLEQKAIVKGYTDNRYRPEQAINLVEAYKIVALSFDFITLDEAYQIVHNQNMQWYEPYKNALEETGVVPLWMKDYEPGQSITRGDMFALLATALRYKDWAKALDWE